jgi:hypothetical protein
MHERTAKLANHETAIAVLQRLNEIGAINLDIIVNRGHEIGSILSDVGIDDWDHGICYKNYIRVFYRGEIDTPITSLSDVVVAVKELGIQTRA